MALAKSGLAKLSVMPKSPKGSSAAGFGLAAGLAGALCLGAAAGGLVAAVCVAARGAAGWVTLAELVAIGFAEGAAMTNWVLQLLHLPFLPTAALGAFNCLPHFAQVMLMKFGSVIAMSIDASW